MGEAGTRQGGALRSIALSLALVGASLTASGLSVEFIMRRYAHGSDSSLAAGLRQDPRAVLIDAHGELGYRQKPNSVYSYAATGAMATANRSGFRGPDVSERKREGTLRIVLVGGSTTHGWAVADSETIDSYMRELLRERLPDRTVEVINLAFDGYDSHQIYERLRSDGVRLQPDFVIVNTGINDVRNARYRDLTAGDPRTVLWLSEILRARDEAARGGPRLKTRIRQHFYLARLPGVVHSQLTARSRLAVDSIYPDALDVFEGNLQRIIALIDSAGGTTLLSTEPSALLSRHDPGERARISYWIGDAATTQAYRDSLGLRLQRAATTAADRGLRVARVPYVELPAELFLDDAHLTPAGNLRLAAVFADAVARQLLPAPST